MRHSCIQLTLQGPHTQCNIKHKSTHPNDQPITSPQSLPKEDRQNCISVDSVYGAGGYLLLKFITTSQLRHGYVNQNSYYMGCQTHVHTCMHTCIHVCMQEEFGKKPRLVAETGQFFSSGAHF